MNPEDDPVSKSQTEKLLSPSIEPPSRGIERLESDLVPEELPARLVYLFESDPELARNLALQLSYFGYRVRSFERPSLLHAALGDAWPNAIILDIELSGGDLAATVAAINSLLKKQIPVIFLSARQDFSARLAAVRAGSAAYIDKPVEVRKLVDKLDALTSVQLQEPCRVLIVEDSATQSAWCAYVLRQAGMLTHTVIDPAQLLDAMAEFNPELVLMDMYLPDCSGVELARLIRQTDVYFSLPIVFLSIEASFEKQLDAMRLGGDEFLTKPITPAHLVAAVTPRVERYRMLRAMMAQDSLTGLINHVRLQQQLDFEVARACRQKTPLSFAMIDIDHFKIVNDSYGHPAGDRVLMSISRFLRQRLRKTDVVGRYGGEEFGSILTDTGGVLAQMVLDRIRDDFSKVEHPQGDSKFSVSFSAGIASLGANSSAGELVLAADQALYRAKNQGRNLIVLA